MKKLPDKFKLLLVGEGILEKKIKRTIIDNNLSDRVMMLGFRHDIARIMNTIDVLGIPSKWEGFGLVAVEAMACGKNIVAADVPGLSQVLGDVGFKIKLEDENEFINAIYSAVESMKDRIVVEKLISQSQKYDINLVASNYYNLFNKLKNEL